MNVGPSLQSLRRNTVTTKMPKTLGKSRLRQVRDGGFIIPRRDLEAEEWLDANCIRVANELKWYPKLAKEVSVEALRDVYKDLPVYIVGKGPSLDKITAADFKNPAAPILAINESVMIINALELPNPVYLVQGDGGLNIELGSAIPVLGICVMHLYPESVERYIFRSEMFGYGVSARLSVEMAVHIGGLMGCSEAFLMAFDACTSKTLGYAKSIGHEPKLQGKEQIPGERFAGHRHWAERASKDAHIPVCWIKPEDLVGEVSDSTPPSLCNPVERHEPLKEDAQHSTELPPTED
jgi:hypothetical protein